MCKIYLNYYFLFAKLHLNIYGSLSYRLLKDKKNFKKLEIFRTLTDEALTALREFMPDIQISQNVFSTIARPTTGIRRTAIWGLRVRD